MGPKFHPGALADFTEAHEWYLDVDIDVAAAFRQAPEHTIDRIQATPVSLLRLLEGLLLTDSEGQKG